MNDADLTIEENVVALMQSSTSEREWNANCDRVKVANGSQYPSYWYKAIVLSGVMGTVCRNF
jgi:cellulase/cellobiase CelA1